MDEPHDKSLRGNASQFFVAGELCRRGWVAVVTLGNTPNTDILCSNVAGTKFVHVQVKTFLPGNRTVSVGVKAERDYGPNFVWILAGIPNERSSAPFEYYVIPSSEMSRYVSAGHSKWLADKPERRDSKVRTVTLPPRSNYVGWGIGEYKDNWKLIEGLLLADSGERG